MNLSAKQMSLPSKSDPETLETKVETKAFDYWTLRITRDTAAISLFCALPIISVFGSRAAPAVLVFAVLFTLLGHLITSFRHFDYKPSIVNPFAWISLQKSWGMLSMPVTLLFCWVCLSGLWSLDAQPAPKLLATVALLILSVPYLAHEFRHLIIMLLERMALIGIVSFCTYLILEYFLELKLYGLFIEKGVLDPIRGEKGPGWHDLGRPFALVALLFWIVWSSREKVLSGTILRSMFLALMAAALFLSVTQSIKLGFLAAALTGLLVYAMPAIWKSLIWMSAALFLIFPLLVPHIKFVEPLLKQDVVWAQQMSRVQIWEHYARFISQKPITGWGVNSEHVLGEIRPDSYLGRELEVVSMSSHAHSFMLQLWTDYGLVGAVLFVWILILIGQRIGAWPAKSRLLNAQLLLAILAYSSVSHSITQSWWLATIAIAAIAGYNRHLEELDHVADKDATGAKTV